MDSFLSALSDFLSVSNTTSAFMVVISLVLTIIYFRKDKSYDAKKERFEQLISPLFFMLEPFLYRDIDSGNLSTILSFIESKRLYADANILESAYYCKTAPTKTNFMRLCRCIDKLYDRYSFSLSLKLRSRKYRVAKKQYKNKYELFLFVLLGGLQYARTPLLCFFAVYFLVLLSVKFSVAFFLLACTLMPISFLVSVITLIRNIRSENRESKEMAQLF